jgi:hypothetical protein
MTVPSSTRSRLAAVARRAAVIGALELVASGASAPVASAGSDERIDVKYGYARFDSDGEKLAAGDIHKDGIGVRARLGWEDENGPHTVSVVDTFAGYESSKNLSIAEGTTVYLQLCYVRGSQDLNCTRVRAAEA